MISYILDVYYSLQTIIINTEIILMNYINTNYMYLLKFDEQRKQCSHLSYDFQKYKCPARKDPSYLYPRFRVLPHLASRGTVKKRGLDLEEVEG